MERSRLKTHVSHWTLYNRWQCLTNRSVLTFITFIADWDIVIWSYGVPRPSFFLARLWSRQDTMMVLRQVIGYVLGRLYLCPGFQITFYTSLTSKDFSHTEKGLWRYPLINQTYQLTSSAIPRAYVLLGYANLTLCLYNFVKQVNIHCNKIVITTLESTLFVTSNSFKYALKKSRINSHGARRSLPLQYRC